MHHCAPHDVPSENWKKWTVVVQMRQDSFFCCQTYHKNGTLAEMTKNDMAGVDETCDDTELPFLKFITIFRSE